LDPVFTSGDVLNQRVGRIALAFVFVSDGIDTMALFFLAHMGGISSSYL